VSLNILTNPLQVTSGRGNVKLKGLYKIFMMECVKGGLYIREFITRSKSKIQQAILLVYKTF
jgi:hypothetical protein